MTIGNLFIHVSAWQVLAAIGILLAASEIFIAGFVMLPLGIAFLLTAVVALFVHNTAALLFTLAATEVGVFVFFQKGLHRFQGKTKAYTNAEGMIGQECEVTETIPVNGSGYVKLYGDRWQAKSFEREPLVNGTRVIIVKIEGNKVLVEPLNRVEEN